MGVFEPLPPLPAPVFRLPNIGGFDALFALLVPGAPKGEAVPLEELPTFPNRLLPVLALEPPWLALAPNGELEPKRPPAVAPLEEGVPNENVLLLDMIAGSKGPRKGALLCEDADELGASWIHEVTPTSLQLIRNNRTTRVANPGTCEVDVAIFTLAENRESRCVSQYSAYY